jgi:hypothetical protein
MKTRGATGKGTGDILPVLFAVQVRSQAAKAVRFFLF